MTGGFIPPPIGLHELHRLRPAARRQRHPPEPLEQHHVELGLLLIAAERDLGEHFALVGGDVVRREPVQGVHHHVPVARLAATEPGQLGAQPLVFPLHHLERHVRHPTTVSSRRCVCAVKVEPVVPVSRTVRYVPIHSAGPASSATLLVRVRVWSSSPRLACPSTSTSCVVPTRPAFLRAACPRTTAMSRPSRSLATSSGTASLSRSAGVPSRGENLKVKASSKPAAGTRDIVCWKSSSVSPGNPTMRSVESAIPETACRSAATTAR